MHFVKAGGTVKVLTAEQRAAWAKSMPNVAKQWAEGLEAKGIPGKKILATYMDNGCGRRTSRSCVTGTRNSARTVLEIVLGDIHDG